MKLINVLLGAYLATACSGSDGSEKIDGGISDAPSDVAEIDSATDSGAGPIVAPADQWTWVDVPGSKCASGTATGFGVNLHPGAKNVVFYFEGGGACSSGTACWGPNPTAHSLDGYDADKFSMTPQLSLPILSRNPAIPSPFADLSFVFIPYCTGDMHAGTKDIDLTYNGAPIHTYFWGAKDLEMFLPRITATFPDADHVWVAGGSAGGYGTVLSFDRIATAFDTRVDMIDDSGPSILPKGGTQNGQLATWGFVTPANCTAPCNSHANVLAAARARQPDSKFAFMSFTADPTISADNGYTLDEYPAVLDTFIGTFDAGSHAFLVTNDQRHVVESEGPLAVQYLPWLQQMHDDAPAWANVTYNKP
jgi:hypothetical protein